MAQPICRVGDVVVGRCEANAPGHPRDFVGTWSVGSDKSTCDGIGVIRVGDIGHTDCDHTFIAVDGSDITQEDGVGIVRVGDVVHVIEGGVGVATTGSDTGTTE